ncbi:MAG: rRNA pseudouridine synthase [Anaerolineales bacterium]|nr:rRNA pseudouridine synthase [Anaerolineales bacterium]MCB8951762.1 rRNA pseudouridine synthase [Ardenticatenales bacterium]
MNERLQKLMAQAGLGSRRHNEELIRAGRVRVNGRIAQLGESADPETDKIEVDGQIIEPQKPIYIMLHKPRNVLSSTEDELSEGRRTVRDLVDLPGHLYPVGRLDRNSTGLILLTNDGELANRLTHPRYEHPKVYSVQVVGQLTPEGLAQWQQGMLLDGEMTAPAEIKVRRQTEDGARLRIVMREGRKRQIRRVAALLGLEVRSLHRTAIGPLHLGDLKPGEWRRLTAGEVAALRRDVRRQEKKRRHGKPWHDKRRENANLKRRRTD